LQVGTLAPGAATATGHLTTASSGLIQFTLGSVAANGAAGATVTLTLTDATGKKVVTATQTTGLAPLFLSQYLPAGDYTLTLTLGVPKGVSVPGVTYWLSGGLGSDPIGPYSTTTKNGPGTTGGTTTGGTTTGTTGGTTTASTD